MPNDTLQMLQGGAGMAVAEAAHLVTATPNGNGELIAKLIVQVCIAITTIWSILRTKK